MEDSKREEILNFVKDKYHKDKAKSSFVDVDQDSFDLSKIRTGDEGLDTMYNGIVLGKDMGIIASYVSDLEYFLDNNMEKLSKESNLINRNQISEEEKQILLTKLKKAKKILEVSRSIGKKQRVK